MIGMFRVLTLAAAVVYMASAYAAGFYNSAEYYSLFNRSGTWGMLVDELFAYETSGLDKDREDCTEVFGVSADSALSESDKAAYVYRARLLRARYRRSVEDAKKRLVRPRGWRVDRIKFAPDAGIRPPRIKEWIATPSGTVCLSEVKAADTAGLLDLIVNETGPEKVRPLSVLKRAHRRTGGTDIDELVTRYWRAMVAVNRLEREEAVRRSSARTVSGGRGLSGSPKSDGPHGASARFRGN